MKLVDLTGDLAERIPEEEAIKILCEAGYDGIDYTMVPTDHPILCDKQYEKRAKELLNIVQSYGKTFEQTHAPFPSYIELDDEYNKDVFDKLKIALEINAILGSKVCIVHPIITQENEWERNMEFYRGLEPVAEQYGVKIALENMWRVVDDKIVAATCGTPDEFNRYLDELDDKNFTGCLDLGHCSLGGEDAADMLRKMGGNRVKALHIHDNDYIHDTHHLPYMMDMKWDTILEALVDIDYSGNFTYEADRFVRNFPIEFLPTAVKFKHDLGRFMMNKIEELKQSKKA